MGDTIEQRASELAAYVLNDCADLSSSWAGGRVERDYDAAEKLIAEALRTERRLVLEQVRDMLDRAIAELPNGQEHSDTLEPNSAIFRPKG